MCTPGLTSWPERGRGNEIDQTGIPRVFERPPAGSSLITLLMGAILGEVIAFLFLWHFGWWVALLGAPFAGALLGVASAVLSSRPHPSYSYDERPSRRT